MPSNRIIPVAVAFAALLAVVGAVLLTVGGAQADPPSGFRYGAVTWPSANIIMVQGQELTSSQTSPYRMPLHGTITFTFTGKAHSGCDTGDLSDASVARTCDAASTTTGVAASLSGNQLSLDTAGDTGGNRAVFSAENVGTATITFTASGGGDWAGTTYRFDVEVYEPTVKAHHLDMPASVSMQEGETQFVAINWTGGAADQSSLQQDGVVALPAAIAAVNGNDGIRVALEGAPGSRSVRIDALEDADSADETGEYQLYFGGARALWNGKYVRTLTVNVTDNDEAAQGTQGTQAEGQSTPPLTVSLSNNPAHHNGADAFTFDIHFSEENPVSYLNLKFRAFTVTGGDVHRAQRLQREPSSNIGWRITVQPEGRSDVAVTLPATQDCEADGAICTRDGRMLSNSLSFTVPWLPPANTPATGAPAIVGTPQVGMTLSADTSAIADADGMTNPGFEYRWMRADVLPDTDMDSVTEWTYTPVSPPAVTGAEGATPAAYTLADADGGTAIRVVVDFTDDNGNAESLASASVLVPWPAGPASLAITAEPTVVPAVPTSVAVSTGASGELVVSWNVGFGGSPPTGFKVQWKSGSESYDSSANSARQAIVAGAGTSTYSIPGLANGVEYTVRVIAYNDLGDSPASGEVTGTPEPPNFIVILADDLGYNDVSFNGATDITTPNLDRLADEGILFTSGYATSPICSPSRAGLMTARYPHRFGMEQLVVDNPMDPHQGVPLQETMFPKYLSDAGYHTGMVGKWHLGFAYNYTPRRRGFDHFFGFLGGAHHYWASDASRPSASMLTPMIEDTQAVNLSGYLTDVLTDKAIEFVQDDRDEPFFLYLPYNAPHGPLAAPDHLIQKYAHIADRDRRTYLAMVDSLDQNIGRLLQALEDSGKRENTVIFFLSDQGGAASSDNGALSGGKSRLLEGGIRVPFVASWPAGWPQQEQFDPMVISMDIGATILALANAPVTDETRPLDGVNLDPYIRGGQAGEPHYALFWRKLKAGGTFTVRSGDLKLWANGAGEVRLYDLENDISESRDILAANPDEAARLADLWNEWNSGNVNGVAIPAASIYLRDIKAWFAEYAESHRTEAENAPLRQIAIP